MDNYTSLSFVPSFPVALVITRYLEILSDIPGILYAYCLAASFRTANNYSHLPGIRSFPVVHVFRKILHNAIRSSKILYNLLLLKSCMFAFWLIPYV
jgi:hypothetical protein